MYFISQNIFFAPTLRDVIRIIHRKPRSHINHSCEKTLHVTNSVFISVRKKSMLYSLVARYSLIYLTLIGKIFVLGRLRKVVQKGAYSFFFFFSSSSSFFFHTSILQSQRIYLLGIYTSVFTKLHVIIGYRCKLTVTYSVYMCFSLSLSLSHSLSLYLRVGKCVYVCMCVTRVYP